MISVLEVVGYCASSSMMVLMLMALGIAIALPAIDLWNKRYFIFFFSLVTLCVGVCLIDTIFYGRPGYATVGKIVAFFEFFLLSFMIPMPTALLLHYCKESFTGSRLLRAVMLNWLVFFVLLMLGVFLDWFYTVPDDNNFFRAPWFPLLLIPLIAGMIINICGLILRRKKLSRRYFVAFLIYMLPLTVFITIHAFCDIILIVFLNVGICALSMCYIIVSDQIIHNSRQQREIANQRASVMVLQMRPHFIYNTMMSIYYLCKQDADKAQQVTLDFTTYLRRNFTAIASENTVPFKDELEHTRVSCRGAGAARGYAFCGLRHAAYQL